MGIRQWNTIFTFGHPRPPYSDTIKRLGLPQPVHPTRDHRWRQREFLQVIDLKCIESDIAAGNVEVLQSPIVSDDLVYLI